MEYTNVCIRILSLNPAITPKSINGNTYIVHNILCVHMTLDHVLGSGCSQLAQEMIFI